jgi:hypothetical protein
MSKLRSLQAGEQRVLDRRIDQDGERFVRGLNTNEHQSHMVPCVFTQILILRQPGTEMVIELVKASRG